MIVLVFGILETLVGAFVEVSLDAALAAAFQIFCTILEAIFDIVKNAVVNLVDDVAVDQ